MKTTDFASLLSKYLLSYLPCQRGASDNTLASYEAAFSRLLLYCEEERKLPVHKITIEALSPDLIEGYLNWLCEKQNNSASTRNQRLSAIKAFFKFVCRENPRYIYNCERILQIPMKKCPTPVLHYLSYEEIKEMLEKPDASTPKGFRDLLILCLLYDTGARVSELVDLTVGDIRFGKYASIKLTGKGNKSREVPLATKTADLLKIHFQKQNLSGPEKHTQRLFLNPQGRPFTRTGITYILQKYAPAGHEKITPHILRHPNVKPKTQIFYITKTQAVKALLVTSSMYSTDRDLIVDMLTKKKAGCVSEKHIPPSLICLPAAAGHGSLPPCRSRGRKPYDTTPPCVENGGPCLPYRSPG